MAINFLNSINFNKNQLLGVVIESLGTAPTSQVAEGQMYFDSSAADKTMYFYNGTDWIPMDGSAAGTMSQFYIRDSVGTQDETITNDTYVQFTASTGTAGVALSGSGTTGAPYVVGISLPDTNTEYTAGDGLTLNTLEFDVNVDTTSQVVVANSLTSTLLRTYAVQLDDQAENLVVNVPWTDNNSQNTYVLQKPAASNELGLFLNGSASAQNNVKFANNDGNIDIDSSVIDTFGIELADDVDIAASLTVGTTATVTGELIVSGTGQSSFAGQVTVQATPSADTDAASKGYVLSQVGGLGSFQGGYNATSNPGSPALTGSSNIAVGNGDFYVVTAPGDITFSDSPTGDATLEVGDFIFANTDIAVNSNPASTDYTLVIADDNVAGVGATDAATIKGVAGFDSEQFTATSNGWIQAKEATANDPGIARVIGGTGITVSDITNGAFTLTADTSGTALFESVTLNTSGANVTSQSGAPTGTTGWVIDVSGVFPSAVSDAIGVKCEVVQQETDGGSTVYPLITRANEFLTINFTDLPSAPSQGDYIALLTTR